MGNKFGKGPLSTVAGVVLGGLGANAWEARENRYVCGSPTNQYWLIDRSRNRDKKHGGRDHRRAKSSSGRMEPYAYDDEPRKSRGRDDYDGYDSAEDASDDSASRRKKDRKEKRRGSERDGGRQQGYLEDRDR